MSATRRNDSAVMASITSELQRAAATYAQNLKHVSIAVSRALVVGRGVEPPLTVETDPVALAEAVHDHAVALLASATRIAEQRRMITAITRCLQDIAQSQSND